MKLSDRVVDALVSEGRPRTNKQLATLLKLKPRDMTALGSALTDLARSKRARYVNGEGWTTEGCAGPVEAVVANGKSAAIAAKLEQKAATKSAADRANTQSEGAAGGGDSDDSAAKAMPTAPKRGGGPGQFGEATRAILKALSSGQKTRTQLVALFPEMEASLDNRLWTLKGSGHIVRVGRATYALPGNTVADALDIRLPNDSPDAAPTIETGYDFRSTEPLRAAPTVSIHAQGSYLCDPRCTDEKCYREPGVGPCNRPAPARSIAEVADRYVESAKKHDVRDALLDSIAMVKAGTLRADQVDAICKLARTVMDIDCLPAEAQ